MKDYIIGLIVEIAYIILSFIFVENKVEAAFTSITMIFFIIAFIEIRRHLKKHAEKSYKKYIENKAIDEVLIEQKKQELKKQYNIK